MNEAKMPSHSFSNYGQGLRGSASCNGVAFPLSSGDGALEALN
jgi:hypothetical protein